MRLILALVVMLCASTFAHAQNARRHFRVETTPQGDVPLWVREAWIGMTLPYLQKSECTALGVVTDRLMYTPRAYFVDQLTVLEKLARHSPEAFAWWKKHGYPQAEESMFCFWFDEFVS